VIAAEARARVAAALDGIEAREGVRILFAVESGSRAWGFPSPDSDYDCRFVHLRPLGDYLKLIPPRDFIEMPIEDDLDVNGWDARKALLLLLKGNAVVIEWLTAPIVYRERPGERAGWLDLAERIAPRAGIARHYLHLGESMFDRARGTGRPIKLKKLFYALRPAAALRWLRLHENAVVAPMHFPILMAECDAPRDVLDATADLLARKAATREMGEGESPACLIDFMAAEFATARQTWPQRSPRPGREAVEAADAFFRRLVGLS